MIRSEEIFAENPLLVTENDIEWYDIVNNIMVI